MPGKYATPSKKAEESPYKTAVDSPSRQLLWEMQEMSICEHRTFYDTLDQRDQANAAAYESALSKAATSHDIVRTNAENALEKHRINVESEKALKRQEALTRAEIAKREKLERELAETKEANRAQLAAETARLKLEEEKRNHEAALEKARLASEQAKAEEARKSAEREEAEKKRKAQEKALQAAQAARAAQAAQEAQQSKAAAAAKALPEAAQAPVPDLGPIAHDVDEKRAAKHVKYLEIHQKLKELRKNLVEAAKSNAELKQGMGDSRRTIRKCVGQLTGEPAANRGRVSHEIQLT